MFRKKMALTMALLMLVGSLAACGNGTGGGGATPPTGSGTAAPTGGGGGEAPAQTLKVTFITTASGLGDRSLNDSTWAGLQRAEAELGVEVSVIQPAAVSDLGSSVLAAVNGGADVVLGFGAIWSDVFEEYCPKYPDVYFAGLNCSAESDNLVVAQTGDHQGSFLAGALAALMSKTGTIGAVGGQDADNINRFLVGYEEGAKYVRPDVTVLKSYVGSYSDPAKGKEFSQQLANQGADVIYQVAGGTGEGVFEAAKENENLYAIGVDANQDYIAEGKILTSMIKNCDSIAYDVVQRVLDGTFESGYKIYDLGNDGVGLSPMEFTRGLIGDEILSQIEDLRQKIISGEIVVTDLFNP